MADQPANRGPSARLVRHLREGGVSPEPGLSCRRVWRWSLILLLSTFSGCGGCRSDEAVDESEEKPAAEQPLEDFSFGRLQSQPADPARIEFPAKPGHWVGGTMEVTANYFDFVGQMNYDLVDENSRELDLDEMPFHVENVRPALLPKEQDRVLEFGMFLPADPPRLMMSTQLRTSRGQLAVSRNDIITRMPAHQYFMLVLAARPDDYRYVVSLDSIRAPSGAFLDATNEAHYRVIAPIDTKRISLPTNPLQWTQLAYVLWDDFDPTVLTSYQQAAMLDWLHWGGQLVISGPRSLNLLRQSFLEDYLPADSDTVREIAESDLETLRGTAWSPRGRPLAIAKAWTGVDLDLRDEGNVLLASPDERPLVVERRVGRGRIVVSAFQLGQRELINWPGCDRFFNAFLLRRPPRMFGETEFVEVGVRWADRREAFDSGRTTNVRFFTRDAEGSGPGLEELSRARNTRDKRRDMNLAANDPLGGGGDTAYRIHDGPGTAGWDDFSDASQLARRSLREAANIAVPGAGFVAAVVAAYVLVLVPLNWLLFRALGRVEWAWAAAPLIALVFAFIVVKQAQLNVGFARSQSEVAVLELQGGHPRAHVTRYMALYTSLGTSYDLRFSDPTSLVLPFADDFGGGRLQESRQTVVFRQQRVVAEGDEDERETTYVGLEGFEVGSNSMKMLHGEQMLEMAGPLTIKGLGGGHWQIENLTELDLHGALVVARGHDDSWKTAEIGQIDSLAPVNFTLSPWNRKDDELPAISVPVPVDVAELGKLALNTVERGEIRLVAVVMEAPDGVSVEPSAAQVREDALLVAHLRFDFEPDKVPVPRPDGNWRPVAQVTEN